MTTFPNGLGMVGDPVITNRPLYLTKGAPGGQVWYVNSATGADAASPRGLSPEYPLATLGQGVTNAGANDIIVLMAGHTETLSGITFGISRRTTIVGEGLADGKPTVKLTASGSNTLLTTTASTQNCVTLKNIWFTQPSSASTAPVLDLSSGRDVIDGCYFECGANNGSGAYAVAVSGAVDIINSTFVSVATSKTTQPDPAIHSGAALSQVRLSGVTFDGGAYGFLTYAFQQTGATWTDVCAENITLLRGADMQFSTNTTGYVQVSAMTGGARLEWGNGTPTYYPSGLGDTTGTRYTTGPNVWTTGQVWWVNSAIGTDSTTTTHGKTPEWPLATLAYAWGQSATGDTIVLMNGHTETLTSPLSNIGSVRTVVGFGRSNGQPTVRLTQGGASGIFGTAGGGAVTHLRNLAFEAPTVPATLPPVAMGSFIGAGSNMIIDSCYFACGSLVTGTGSGMYVDGDRIRVTNCAFVSAATSRTSRPLPALYHNGNPAAATRDYFSLADTSFDGATYGWQDAAFKIANVTLALRAQNVSLLNGADISFATTSGGYLVTLTTTGNSRVVW